MIQTHDLIILFVLWYRFVS